MLSNPTPSVGEKERKVEQDPTKFHNWAGRGAAHLFLPKIKENPLVARVKVLEEKVMVSDDKIAELETKLGTAQVYQSGDNRTLAETSDHLVGLFSM